MDVFAAASARPRHNGSVTHSMIERELKFDVEPDFVVPDITALLPEGGCVETATEHLRSDYFDTPDRALLKAHLTLRRRTGSTDTGWQLKIPHPPFREEIRTGPTADDDVPAELRQLLVGVARGQALTQIASVRTQRSVTRLLDAAGRRVAEIDDDTVHASSAGEAATATSWREVEVELVEDDIELLYAVGKRLRRAGAHASVSTSKLARALPDTPMPDTTMPDTTMPDTPMPNETMPNETSKAEKSTKKGARLRAGDVVAAYIAEQQQAILAGDLGLRRLDDSVIHKTRVATRRLRSTLRIYGSLLDAGRAAALDGELRWYAALLGEVRDRQVLRKRLDAMLDDLDDTLQLGPVRARVHTELDHEQAEHWQSLQHDITGPRYLALLADIDAWVTRLPCTAAAGKPARAMAKLLAQAEKKVSRRLEHANATGDIHLLHDARKAAKRARYAAEAAQPVIGARAAAVHADRYQRLQDLLGEHQDSLVSAELLRRLGTKAGSIQGENGFAFGILYEREQQAARTARTEARRVARTYR